MMGMKVLVTLFFCSKSKLPSKTNSTSEGTIRWLYSGFKAGRARDLSLSRPLSSSNPRKGITARLTTTCKASLPNKHNDLFFTTISKHEFSTTARQHIYAPRARKTSQSATLKRVLCCVEAVPSLHY
jgi:hypothetical protein